MSLPGDTIRRHELGLVIQSSWGVGVLGFRVWGYRDIEEHRDAYGLGSIKGLGLPGLEASGLRVEA